MSANLKSNYISFKKEFESYCKERKSSAKLLAVSKTKPLADIYSLLEEGQTLFGENYAQELRDKNYDNNTNHGKNLEWHYIGQIQKNKIKYIVGTSALIHTVDSYEKARLIDNLSKKNNFKQKILLQINISDDPKKGGTRLDQTQNLVEKIKTLENVSLGGLMTITEFSENPEESRKYYKELKKLSLDLNSYFSHPPHLSMGMSNDYKIAIDEGATIVRIGSRIFGKRKKTL